MENKPDICRCCLETSINLINIEQKQDYFSDSVINILDKYFWFESKHLNELPNFICSTCWQIVQQFHTFILRIQEIHTNPSCLFQYVKIECEDYESNKDLANNDDQRDAADNKAIVVSSLSGAADDDNYVSVKNEQEKDRSNEYIDDFPNADDSSSDAHIADDNTDDGDDDDDRDIENEKLKQKKPKKVLKKKTKCSKIGSVSESEKRAISNAKRLELDKKIAEFFQIKCNECGKEESTLLSLKIHTRTVHNKKSFIVCCKKKLYGRYEVLDHLDHHVNPAALKCPTCNKIYAHRKGLKLHMKRHEGKIYVCDLCGKLYAHKSILIQHMRNIHVTQDKQEYICKDCGKSFRSNSILQTHIRGVHENAYLHICDICAKLFKTKEHLNKHYAKHSTNDNNRSNVAATKVPCPICGSMLLNDHLKRHIKNVHIDKPCACPICGKISPNIGAMQSHKRYVHFKQRQYQCTLCEKAFKRSIDLKQHVVTHTGLDAFTCSYCPTTFNCLSNMYKHRKRVHPEEWLRNKMK